MKASAVRNAQRERKIVNDGTPPAGYFSGKGNKNQNIKCGGCPSKVAAHHIPSIAAIILKRHGWREIGGQWLCPACVAQFDLKENL